MPRDAISRSVREADLLAVRVYPIVAVILALLFIFPAEVNAQSSTRLEAQNKNRHTWRQKISKMSQRLRSKIRGNSWRKFSMMSRRGNQKKLVDPKIAQKAAQKAAQQSVSRTSQYHRVAELKARVKECNNAAKKYRKKAKRAKAAGNIKDFMLETINANSWEEQALTAKGDMYTLMGVIKREDELRQKRVDQSRRNFSKHKYRAKKARNSRDDSRGHHQIRVLKTKVRVLASKIEMLNAQANVAQFEGDRVGAREMKNEARLLAGQINQLRSNINNLEIGARSRVAGSARGRPTQTPQQRALNKFRMNHITPDYLMGKVTGALQLLKKYEAFAGGSPALEGGAI